MSKPTRYNGSSHRFLVNPHEGVAIRIPRNTKIEILKNELVLESKLELDTFFALSHQFGATNIKAHQPVHLIDEGKYLAKENWKIDFVVCHNDCPILYIESKGILDKLTILKLKILHALRPDVFALFLFVVPDRVLAQSRLLQKMRQFNHCVAISELKAWLNYYQPNINQRII